MAKIFGKTSDSTTSCSQKDMKDLIAKKAYDLYVKSGCKAGHDLVGDYAEAGESAYENDASMVKSLT